MKIRTGDLLQLAQGGVFDVIVHGCNCFHTMGAGIAGGNWDDIAPRIDAAHAGMDHTLVVQP